MKRYRNVLKEMRVLENDLIESEKIELKTFIRPESFGNIVHISLHSFSDTSELGHRESSYRD